MTFAQQRNRVSTHFSERIPVVKRRISIFLYWVYDGKVLDSLSKQ